MYAPQRNRDLSPQAGASIIAALIFVGVLGIIAFTLESVHPSSRVVSLTVDPQSQVAALTSTERTGTTAAISDQCKPGEVHTIRENTGSFEVPQDRTLQCYVPDTASTPPKWKPNPLITSDTDKAACALLKDPNICIVRYCPLDSMVQTPGSCIVITCPAQNGSQCLKNALNSSLTLGSSNSVIPALLSQNSAGASVMYSSNGSRYPINGSSILTDAFLSSQGAQGVASEQLSQNQNQLNNVSQQLNNCAYGECDAATVQNLQTQQANLRAANDRLRQQIVALSQQQTQISQPGTTGGEQTPLPRPRPDVTEDGGSGQTFPPPQPSSGYNQQRPVQQGVWYQIGRMIGNLFGSSGNTTQQQVACATNYDQYNQQLQQYQNQQQQYNYQMQQYNYQQQQQYYQPQQYGSGYQVMSTDPVIVVPNQQPYGYSNYGYGYGTTPSVPPQPPQPCYNNANPTQCNASPQQPNSSQCTSGTWKPTTAAGNGCISGWQCVPHPSAGGTGTGTENGARTPTAQLSCQPHVADVGMKLAISFACQNAEISAGQGFDTGGRLASSTTVTVAEPPSNADALTYALTCTNFGITSSAQCSIQINRPMIALTATPARVHRGEQTTIGWVTSGMHACVVASAQMADFTAQNAGNTSVNGAAVTPAITAPTDISLRCTTLGGATRVATTSIQVIRQE